MRAFAVVLVAAVLRFDGNTSHGAVWTDPCGPDAGSCAEPNGTPGCDEASCCAAVCAFLPQCCEIAWDDLCVALRAVFPDDCTGTVNPACGPGTGSCTQPNPTPGCEDPECCDLVCTLDPFCCDEFWDAGCAAVALQFCGVWPCSVECPPMALDEKEPCGAMLNDGCNMAKPSFVTLPLGSTICGTVWEENQMRDTDWFKVTIPAHPQGGLVAVTMTLVAEPAVALLLIKTNACPLGAPVVLQSAFGGGCRELTMVGHVMPGTYALVVTPGVVTAPVFEGFPCGTLNRYTLRATIGNDRPRCVADLNDDGVVDAADLGQLLGMWGPVPPGTSVIADLNGDGVVDAADLGLLLAAWGSCPYR